jgi:hypothetical protein
LRAESRNKFALLIPKENRLQLSSRDALFEGCGGRYKGLATVESVLKVMAETRCEHTSFRLSHLDIFLEGLTDIGRKLFFSAGMCWDLADFLVSVTGTPEALIGMGHAEQQFLDAYVRLLAEHAIAHIDYSDVLIDIRERQLFPTLLVPLTSKGKAIRDLCRTIGGSGVRYGLTEAPLSLMDSPSRGQRVAENIDVAKRIREHFKRLSNDKPQT